MFRGLSTLRVVSFNVVRPRSAVCLVGTNVRWHSTMRFMTHLAREYSSTISGFSSVSGFPRASRSNSVDGFPVEEHRLEYPTYTTPVLWRGVDELPPRALRVLTHLFLLEDTNSLSAFWVVMWGVSLRRWHDYE